MALQANFWNLEKLRPKQQLVTLLQFN